MTVYLNSIAFSGALAFSDFPDDWLPASPAFTSRPIVGGEQLGSFGRAAEVPYTDGLLTKQPIEIDHWFIGQTTWSFEEALQEPEEEWLTEEAGEDE